MNFVSKSQLESMREQKHFQSEMKKKCRDNNYEQKIKDKVLKRVNVADFAKVAGGGRRRRPEPEEREPPQRVMLRKSYNEWKENLRMCVVNSLGKMDGNDKTLVGNLKQSEDINSIVYDKIMGYSDYIDNSDLWVVLATAVTKFGELKSQ